MRKEENGELPCSFLHPEPSTSEVVKQRRGRRRHKQGLGVVLYVPSSFVAGVVLMRGQRFSKKIGACGGLLYCLRCCQRRSPPTKSKSYRRRG